MGYSVGEGIFLCLLCRVGVFLVYVEVEDLEGFFG